MADTKISQLPSATTPLSGAELVPLVQSGATVQTPTNEISKLTAATANTFTANQIISVTDNTNAALRVTQLGTAAALRIEDSTNPDNTPFIVDASGNVGVGVTPVYKMDISAIGVSIGAQIATNQSGSYLSFLDNGGLSEYVRVGSVDNNLAFIAGNAERMRIDSSGNVAIGTASTGDKFHIRQAGSVYAKIQCDNVGAGAGWYFTNTTTNWLIGSGPVSGGGEFAFYDATRTVERFRIDTSGNVLVTSSGGLGYGTNSGGTVTQLTSKSTGVTLNKTNGQITMNAAALGAGAFVNFQVTNSTVTATDTVIANVGAGGFGGNYYVNVTFCTSGSFGLRVTNQSGGSLSEAVVINFAIIKAVTS